MLQITRQTEYAIRGLQELARRYPKLPVLAARIFGHPKQDPGLAL